MLVLLYTAYFLCRCAETFSNQKYARRSKGAGDFLIYALITGALAMAVFYITSGFCIALNIRTCIYAFIFAAVIFVNYFFSLAVFKYMGVAESTFTRSGLSLILTVAMGVVLYGEPFTWASLVQILLVLMTLLTIFLPASRKDGNVKTVTVAGIFLCIGTAVLGMCCSVITKAFAIDDGVVNESSFLFMTNAFIFLFALISVVVTSKASVKSIVCKLKKISGVGYVLIVMSVVASNFISLLQVIILREGDLVLYAPLSSALGLIAGEAVAVFTAKERPRIMATVLAISSVLVISLF